MHGVRQVHCQKVRQQPGSVRWEGGNEADNKMTQNLFNCLKLSIVFTNRRYNHKIVLTGSGGWADGAWAGADDNFGIRIVVWSGGNMIT